MTVTKLEMCRPLAPVASSESILNVGDPTYELEPKKCSLCPCLRPVVHVDYPELGVVLCGVSVKLGVRTPWIYLWKHSKANP
jgi:hypothetical protein